jgi:hypothetical protein
MKRLQSLLPALMFFALPPSAAHAQPRLLVGASEDAVKQPTFAAAQAKMDLAKLAGFNAIRVTATWTPGQSRPSEWDALVLGNAAAAAQLDGVRLFVSVFPAAGRLAPLTAVARAQFASYAAALAEQLPGVTDFIIGNEPNLNRFWLPQFTRRGTDSAASAYELLLARTYDALKSVNPEINVIGGALSPRGEDRPDSRRPTHSPTTFLRDLGRAYRGSGRTRPIMDMLSFHPYPEHARTPPTLSHPRTSVIGLNDYAKLVRLLGAAFGGTAQPGGTMPILYDEFGVQSQIGLGKRGLYTHGSAPAARDAVSEPMQATYYRQALQLAACQARVVGLLFFHLSDEIDLRAWQSGLFYADDSPKTSLEPVRAAAEAAEEGRLAPICSFSPKLAFAP